MTPPRHVRRPVTDPPAEHRVVDVAVVVTCSCGDLVHGDTEGGAIGAWERHVSITDTERGST